MANVGQDCRGRQSHGWVGSTYPIESEKPDGLQIASQAHAGGTGGVGGVLPRRLFGVVTAR